MNKNKFEQLATCVFLIVIAIVLFLAGVDCGKYSKDVENNTKREIIICYSDSNGNLYLDSNKSIQFDPNSNYVKMLMDR